MRDYHNHIKEIASKSKLNKSEIRWIDEGTALVLETHDSIDNNEEIAVG